jgi:hypothetical protein
VYSAVAAIIAAVKLRPNTLIVRSDRPVSQSNLENTGGFQAVPRALVWNALAALVALAGTAGSLWLSLGLELKACPLCLYQRTFLMGAAAVLLIGLLTDARYSPLLALLAWPAVWGGLGVAVFHEYLEATGKLECPAGLLGLGTAPQQSLALFVVLTAVLGAAVVFGCRQSQSGLRLPVALCSIVLGGLLAAGTVLSAPPMPAAPNEPYQKPLDMCRPPYYQLQT